MRRKLDWFVENRVVNLANRMALVMMLFGLKAFGQDGNQGIQEATNRVKGYFDAGCDLMYAIGAVVGIVGAVKVLCAMN